jgi:pre-mRNA-splicing factor ATP-dependent RNA helicase DHX15/PRP43
LHNGFPDFALPQVVNLHPSCGLDTQPEWVIFNEFVLTARPYIRTVTDVRPQWLLDFAGPYFDLSTFPDGETKRALIRVLKKDTSKKSSRGDTPTNGDRPHKKAKVSQ